MENITVFASIKLPKEKNENNFIVESKKIKNRITKEIFNLDSIFNQSSSRKDIFEKLIKQNLSSLLKNINLSIISYGETESGKSYIFKGDNNNPNEGLIQLSIKEIFNLLNNKSSSVKKYSVKISYLEIYNEEINDLINYSNKNLEIKELLNKELTINNLSEIKIENEETVLEILDKSEKIKENDKLCKAHNIFKVDIEYYINDKNNKEKKFNSTLSFVDIEGCENLAKIKNDGNKINKSLICFKNVINKLNQNNNSFINYRESKLTRLLQKSFNGNNKTIIICSLIDDNKHYSESLKTLYLAKKIKGIKINNKKKKINNNKVKSEEENKALRNKIKLLEKIINNKKSLKQNNVKNKYKNYKSNFNDVKNNEQINKLEKEVSLLKQYLMNNNEDFCSDINSFQEGTDWMSQQGINDNLYKSNIKEGFNSYGKYFGSNIKSAYFNSPFSPKNKNISDLKNISMIKNNNNFKNICMSEIRPETNFSQSYFLNSAFGKTEPPNFNFMDNSNMQVALPDLNNNNFENEIENNYLMKENEELKNNINELKRSYEEIIQSKEEQISIINQNHNMTLENYENLIKQAESNYTNLKLQYDQALEKIKLKDNEFNDLKQKNINKDSSIKFYQKELDKVSDFNYVNELQSKYDSLLEENKKLKENGNLENSQLKEENELLKKNIGMIENKLKEKCKELNENKKNINEIKKLNEKELQKYKFEIKNFQAIDKRNKNNNPKANLKNNNNLNIDKIKEYENKISKLIQENEEYKINLENIQNIQIKEYQKLLDESFDKISQLNKEINDSKDKNKYLEKTLNLINDNENKKIKNEKDKTLLSKKRKNGTKIEKEKFNINDLDENSNKENKNNINTGFSNFEI